MPFALVGVAAEMGVVMLIYLDHAWQAVKETCRAAGREPGVADLYAAVMEGAVERVRPKMMTVVAIMAGRATAFPRSGCVMSRPANWRFIANPSTGNTAECTSPRPPKH